MNIYDLEHKRLLLRKILVDSLELLSSATRRLNSIEKDFRDREILNSEAIKSGFSNAMSDVLECRYKVGTPDSLEEIFMPLLANLNDASYYFRGCVEPWANGMATPPLTPRIVSIILNEIEDAMAGIKQVYEIIASKDNELKTLSDDEIRIV